MGIMLRMRTLPAGFIAPCLPTKTDKLPWVISKQLTRLVFRAQPLPHAASSPKNRSARHRAALSPS
jgi:hypothetical protein